MKIYVVKLIRYEKEVEDLKNKLENKDVVILNLKETVDKLAVKTRLATISSQTDFEGTSSSRVMIQTDDVSNIHNITASTVTSGSNSNNTVSKVNTDMKQKKRQE